MNNTAWDRAQKEGWERIEKWASELDDEAGNEDVSICLPSDESESILLTYAELEMALKSIPGISLIVTSKS